MLNVINKMTIKKCEGIRFIAQKIKQYPEFFVLWIKNVNINLQRYIFLWDLSKYYFYNCTILLRNIESNKI